jgi:hypothetical protein
MPEEPEDERSTACDASGDPPARISRGEKCGLLLLFVAVILATLTATAAAVIYLPSPFKVLAAIPLVLYFRYGVGDGWIESCVRVVILAVVIGVLLAVLIPVVRALKHM